MQDHIDMYDKEAREWSDELIARVKSDLVSSIRKTLDTFQLNQLYRVISQNYQILPRLGLGSMTPLKDEL